jgi:hypothetical protein
MEFDQLRALASSVAMQTPTNQIDSSTSADDPLRTSRLGVLPYSVGLAARTLSMLLLAGLLHGRN